MDDLIKAQTDKLNKLFDNFESKLAEQEKKAVAHFAKIERETKELEERLEVLSLHLKAVEKGSFDEQASEKEDV